MSRKDEFNETVEILTRNKLSNKPPRSAVVWCRVTPKRIYTAGGAVFDRFTGKQIMKLTDRVWGTYRKQAVPTTIQFQPLTK